MEVTYSAVLNRIYVAKDLLEIRCIGETEFYFGRIVDYDSEFIRLESIHGNHHLIIRANIRRITIHKEIPEYLKNLPHYATGDGTEKV